MDIRLYHLLAELTLEPKYTDRAPEVIVSFSGKTLFNGLLDNPSTFYINQQLEQSTQYISVEFLNSQNNAVILSNLSFNKIQDPRFIWKGIYTPNYPEPWASEQLAQGITLPLHLESQTYLGWNGKWILTFDVPVFTWIHKTLNLGWIYD